MKVNGVTFIDQEAVKLTQEEFINQNINVFWQDIPREKRRLRLVSVYNRIVGKKVDSGGGGD